MTRTHAVGLARSRGFLMVEDVEAIQALVRELADRQPLCAIDLGAGSGTTALAVLDEREDALITTFDVDSANLRWAQLALQNAYPNAEWLGVLADASDTTQHVTGRTVDLLMHDASHERDHVYGDIRAWLPYLGPHSRIWLHDAQAAPESWGQVDYSPQVRDALGALVAEGFIVGELAPGLGWWGRAVQF